MPKQAKPPKYCKMGKYAVVYRHDKKIYLGIYGSPESKVAYSRLVAEIQSTPGVILQKEEKAVTVRELTAAFLDHTEVNTDRTSYLHYRVIILDFLDKFYGDDTPVENFTPRCLKLVREEMVKSGRFCRRTVNDYTFRIVSIFGWGVENDLVLESTWRTLKVVKSLKKNAVGTFDNEEREPVSDEIIRRTLPFMPPTLRAMVQLQRLLGMRPNEIFKMQVGDIDRSRGNGLWYYVPGSYKTSEFVGKITFPLGKPEQDLIAPYLIGKTREAAVFSPRTAQEERNAEKRASRKTKITPSQAARNEARAAKPTRYGEFYTRFSYRQAIEYAIEKGNKTLPEDQQIPKWFPYLLRNSAATATELERSDEDAQALLGHRTVNMTKRYSKTQLKRREKMARNRHNPFEAEGQES